MAVTALKLPRAYEEHDPLPEAAGVAHYVHLEAAEPSPLMKAFGSAWRGLKKLMLIVLVVGLVCAYPAGMLFYSHVDDRPVTIPAQESWAVPGIAVSIHKIARELEGVGWAANRPSYHPQARLSALPAWQSATSSALSEHVMMISELAPFEGQPDRDLAAAARLLAEVPGEPMRPRLTAAAEALNRFDTRASRGMAFRPLAEEILPHELDLFAGWASEDRSALADRIRAGKSGAWLASGDDVAAFYRAKARAHIAHEMLVANTGSALVFADGPIRLAAERAEAALQKAARMKPLLVSNHSGSGFLLPNHLASMAFYLYEAEEACLILSELLAARDASEDATPGVAGEMAGLP